MIETILESNVSAISWKAGNESSTRTYKFSYNALAWLTAASYSGTGNYTTQYTYDKMGNFQTLKRYGKQDGGTYGLIDNLTFTLNGNQVTKIEDSVSDPTYNGCFNFADGASQSNEYTYDQDGNLTKDLNKKISSIQYNLLNLPQSITYSTNKSAIYTYDAKRNKLRVVYTNPSSTIDYCGNMIYEGGTLKQILVDGGYVTFSGSTPTYHYYLQDHLGNNRVVCNASSTVEQVNHYYPFGGLFGESTNGDTQRYKYNGKELDRMHGLDWYDYGARHMDAMRFTTMDPMAEKYYNMSPYAYCANNPIKYVETNGEEPTTYEAALIAKHVYGEKVKLAGGWHVSSIQLKSFNNVDNGYKSALYERKYRGVTEYVYATAGTQDITDFKEDVFQLMGKSSQYEESVNNAQELNSKLSDSELTFVGHSLGGGLAAANALATDRNAITFNPAAITNETKVNLRLPNTTTNGRIFNVVVQGELVNHIQSKLGLNIEGGKYTLNASYLPGNNIINTALRINNHLIDTVIEKIKEELK